MGKAMWRGGVVLSLMAALMLFSGCSGAKKDDDHKDHTHKKDKEEEEDGHTSADGYWCISHGIPEEECSMCSPKVEKECKAKGDWCEKHNRAQSQCFICDPKLKEKFDKKYENKYGKKPPLTDDEKAAKKKEQK